MFLFVRRAVLFTLALAASVCAAGAGVAAQSRDGSKAAECRVAGSAFACPADFAHAAEQSDEEFALMRHVQFDLAVFVAAPAAPFDASAFEERLPAVAASRLFPDDARPYRWKPSEAPAKLGRHETASGASQGFNGRWRVFVEFHRLSVGGRELYVGHAFSPGGRGRQPDAGRLFESGAGAFSVVGECAIQDIVGTLTGEKIDPRGTPCEMMTRPGQDPRGAPGPKTKGARPRAKVAPAPRGGA